MRKEEFIRKVERRISHDCGLPISIKKETIESYMTEAAEELWHRYEIAKEERYLVIDRKNFITPIFKKERLIVLPKCVIGIIGLQESGGHGHGSAMYNNRNPDYKKLGVVFSNGGRLGDRDDMVYNLIERGYESFINSNFTLNTLSFSFNDLTKRLFIQGRDPHNDVIAKVVITIPMENLMDSIYFFKLVMANLYEHVDLILSFVSMDLIGGKTVNTSRLERIGDRYRKEVQEEIEISNDESFLDLI